MLIIDHEMAPLSLTTSMMLTAVAGVAYVQNGHRLKRSDFYWSYVGVNICTNHATEACL